MCTFKSAIECAFYAKYGQHANDRDWRLRQEGMNFALEHFPAPATATEGEGELVGWFDPVTRRLCYTDEKEVWKKRNDSRITRYTVPVFACHTATQQKEGTCEHPDREYVGRQGDFNVYQCVNCKEQFKIRD